MISWGWKQFINDKHRKCKLLPFQNVKLKHSTLDPCKASSGTQAFNTSFYLQFCLQNLCLCFKRLQQSCDHRSSHTRVFYQLPLHQEVRFLEFIETILLCLQITIKTELDIQLPSICLVTALLRNWLQSGSCRWWFCQGSNGHMGTKRKNQEWCFRRPTVYNEGESSLWCGRVLNCNNDKGFETYYSSLF